MNIGAISFYILKRSMSYICPTCQSQNSTALPNLTDKSDKESQEAKELGSQIQFKDKKEDELKKEGEPITSTTTDVEPPAEMNNQISETSTPILTRRLVSTLSSSSNLNENEPNSVNQQSSLPQNRVNTSSTNNLQRQASLPNEQEESNLYKSVIILLSLVILFLVIRRLFMIFDSVFSLS